MHRYTAAPDNDDDHYAAANHANNGTSPAPRAVCYDNDDAPTSLADVDHDVAASVPASHDRGRLPDHAMKLAACALLAFAALCVALVVHDAASLLAALADEADEADEADD